MKMPWKSHKPIFHGHENGDFIFMACSQDHELSMKLQQIILMTHEIMLYGPGCKFMAHEISMKCNSLAIFMSHENFHGPWNSKTCKIGTFMGHETIMKMFYGPWNVKRSDFMGLEINMKIMYQHIIYSKLMSIHTP